MSISTILVALDPNQNEQYVFERALQIAKEIGASLQIFTCVFEKSDKTLDISKEELKSTIETYHGDIVNQYAEVARNMGLTVDTEVIWNEDWEDALIQTATRNPIDIIIKSSYSHKKIKRLLANTSDWNLERNSPCPVLFVKQVRPWSNPLVVIAAIDTESDDQEHLKLTKSISTLLKETTTNYDLEKHAVIAYHDPIKHPYRVQHLEQYGIPTENIHVRDGHADNIIEEYTKEITADLLVIGTVSRKGIPGVILSNMVEKVLDRVSCDVLTIK